MKKILTTTAIALAAFTTSFAQDTDLKPEKGANNLELNFVPLNGKPIQLTYLRYRKFLSPTTAFRLGIGLSFSSNKADSVFASGLSANTNINGTYKKTQMGWNIKPGFEHHYAGTNRLSPYSGLELDIAGASTKEQTPLGLDATDAVIIRTDKNQNKGGFFRIGVNLLAGFDCYVTKHLYLGTELGFGFQMVKYSDFKSTTNILATGATDPDAVKQGSEMNIGPNFNSSIRLGYIF